MFPTRIVDEALYPTIGIWCFSSLTKLSFALTDVQIVPTSGGGGASGGALPGVPGPAASRVVPCVPTGATPRSPPKFPGKTVLPKLRPSEKNRPRCREQESTQPCVPAGTTPQSSPKFPQDDLLLNPQRNSRDALTTGPSNCRTVVPLRPEEHNPPNWCATSALSSPTAVPSCPRSPGGSMFARSLDEGRGEARPPSLALSRSQGSSPGLARVSGSVSPG